MGMMDNNEGVVLRLGFKAYGDESASMMSRDFAIAQIENRGGRVVDSAEDVIAVFPSVDCVMDAVDAVHDIREEVNSVNADALKITMKAAVALGDVVNADMPYGSAQVMQIALTEEVAKVAMKKYMCIERIVLVVDGDLVQLYYLHKRVKK